METLVVDTLSDARAVAFDSGRRWKVVTLNGEVIDPSGLMTSATRKSQSQPSINQLVATPERLLEAEAQLTKLEESIAESFMRREALETTLRDVDGEINAVEAEIKHLHSLRDPRLPLLPILERRYAHNQGCSLTRDELCRVDALAVALQHCQSERKAAEDAIAAQLFKIREIDAMIDLAGEDVKAQRLRLDAAKQNADDKRKALKKEENLIRNAESHFKKSESKLAETENELRDCRHEIQIIEAKITNMVDEGLEVCKAQKKLKSVICKVGKALEGARLAHDINQGRIRQMRRDISEKKDAIGNLEKTLQGLEARANEQTRLLEKFRKEFQQLKEDGFLPCDAPAPDPEDPLHSDLSDMQLDSVDFREIEGDVELLQYFCSKRQPNLRVINTFRQKLDDLKLKREQYERITAQWKEARIALNELNNQRLDMFTSAFNSISSAVRSIYQQLSIGGDAKLEYVQASSPFTQGICFSVRPPTKSWTEISNLSGGEKTLSSLALIFALHKFKRTPMYFLDEVDASLDDGKVASIANYVNLEAKDTQFIVITHSNQMFEVADWIVGVYKVHKVSRALVVNNKPQAREAL